MKTVFIVNPKSANGTTGRRWGELGALVARAIPDSAVEFTRAPMEAATLAARALERGATRIVAVGGDGTLNEVINGFFKDGKPVNPEAAVGVLPRGTGGDFRRTFGWEADLEAAVRRVAGGATRSLDVGLLEYASHAGPTAQRCFVNVCSFGVSGLVDAEVNATSKALGGRISFLWGSLKAMAKYRDLPLRASFDGGPQERLTVTALAVANGRYFGGGMMVAPDADVSDGLFDVTVWSGYGLTDFVFKASGLYSGAHVRWPGTRTVRCRTVTLEADERVLVDCDGEQPGTLPARVTMLPAALRLCC